MYHKESQFNWQILLPAHMIGIRLHRLVSLLNGEGMDFLGPPPRFDGTDFQRWKILMESHLQAKGLNVWRVTSEGMKNKGQQDI